MAGPIIAAEDAFDLAGTSQKLRVCVYAPVLVERSTWACRVQTGAPIDRDRPTHGEGPLQALVLGLCVLAVNLYASDLWRQGQLGWRGAWGGYLGLPSPTSYLDFADYPFDLGGPEQKRQVLADAADDAEPPAPMAEYTFELIDPRHPLGVRIFRPERCQGELWRCRTQIDHPFGIDKYALGHSSLEALWRSLCLIGGELYGSPLWRAGKLGAFDEPGGYLGIPPPTSLAFLTQHSF